MDFTLLPRGFVIGFAIAAPVGPIGLLVIRRTLVAGRLVGFTSGLGAATADAFYGSIAAFGLTFLSGILLSGSVWIRLVGGVFLCYLGLTTLAAKPAQAAASDDRPSLIRAYASTLFLTLTNPATIISFAGVCAGLGLADTRGSYASATLLVAGVFAGSALWWLLLSGGLSLLRARLAEGGLRWVNRISGTILTLFGIAAVLSVASTMRLKR